MNNTGLNNPPTNIKAVKETIQDGFVKYDLYFSSQANYDFACAQTIKLNNILYHRKKSSVVVQDRTVYQDEFGQNYLYRVSAIKDYFRYWAVSPWESDDTFGNPTRSMILSSASCPVRAAIFQNPKLLYPYLTGIISWTNCALQCVKEPKCQYWEYFLKRGWGEG